MDIFDTFRITFVSFFILYIIYWAVVVRFKKVNSGAVIVMIILALVMGVILPSDVKVGLRGMFVGSPAQRPSLHKQLQRRLKRKEEPSIEKLIELLGEDETIDKVYAIKKLTSYGKDAQKAIPALIERLNDRNYVDPRVITDKRYIHKGGPLTVGSMAANALEDMGSITAVPLKDYIQGNPNVGSVLRALNVLRYVDPTGADATYTAILDSKRSDHDKYKIAMSNIRQCASFDQTQRERIVKLVMKAAKSENVKYRMTAAKAIGICKDSMGFETLSQLLKDPHRSVRRQAAAALGQLNIDNPKETMTAETMLINILQNDPDREVRASCASALGHFSSAQVRQALQAVNKDEDPYVQRLAQASLMKMK